MGFDIFKMVCKASVTVFKKPPFYKGRFGGVRCGIRSVTRFLYIRCGRGDGGPETEVAEDLLDHRKEGAGHRPRAGGQEMVAGRFGRSGKNLAHRLPRDLELSGDLADRPTLVVVLLLDELHVDHLQHMPSPCPPSLWVTTVQDLS